MKVKYLKKLNNKTMSNKALINKQQGVSLIEVLITALILGVGLLGVAALQVSSVTSNQEGYFHSQATSIAEDLASKIRASQLVTVIATTDGGTRTNIPYATYLNSYQQNPIDCSVAAADCVGANCSGAQVAAFDFQEACSLAESSLPNPQLRVVTNTAAAAGGAPATRLSIVVDWDSAAAKTGAGEVQNINTRCQAFTGSSTRNCIILELMP
jgi:type IV pilus assembly protein PilV